MNKKKPAAPAIRLVDDIAGAHISSGSIVDDADRARVYRAIAALADTVVAVSINAGNVGAAERAAGTARLSIESALRAESRITDAWRKKVADGNEYYSDAVIAANAIEDALTAAEHDGA